MKFPRVRVFDRWLLFSSSEDLVHLSPLWRECDSEFDHVTIPVEPSVDRGVETVNVHLTRRVRRTSPHVSVGKFAVSRIREWWTGLEPRLLEAGRRGVCPVEPAKLTEEGYSFISVDEARLGAALDAEFAKKTIRISSTTFDGLSDYAVVLDHNDLTQVVCEVSGGAARPRPISLLHPDGLLHSGKMLVYVPDGQFYGYAAPGWFALDAMPFLEEILLSIPPDVFPVVSRIADALGRPDIAIKCRGAQSAISDSIARRRESALRRPSN